METVYADASYLIGCHANDGTFCREHCPAGGGDECDAADHPAILFPHEADAPEHCEVCRALLDVRLTNDGIAYVRELIADGSGDQAVLTKWAEHYAHELYQPAT